MKRMKRKIQNSPILTIIKNILLVVMAINQLCVDDKFIKHFKTYLDKDAVYNFIDNVIKNSKYCSDVMKKNF